MKKRILVAEDNKDLADLIKFALRFLGYEVLIAQDGAEAVKSAISFQPDLILMDMMMPNVSGFEAALQLRQHPETKTIPILAASALVSAENRLRCLASGCNDHIAKPFTTKEMTDVIERLLKDHPVTSTPKVVRLPSRPKPVRG
jgi:CheY-like chemotaxis protein